MFNPFEDKLPTYLDRFSEMKGYGEKRQYVEKEMVRLAREGKLYLTGLMTLGDHQKDIVGDIIFGREIRERQQIHNTPIPAELESAMVTLDMSGDEVRFKNGRIRDSKAKMVGNRALARNPRITLDSPDMRTQSAGSVPIRTAYKILKQHGAYVKHNPPKETSVVERLPEGMQPSGRKSKSRNKRAEGAGGEV